MQNMTPSTEPLSEGQIVKLNQNLTARLLKRKNEFPGNIFQQVLGDDTLIDDFVASILKRVDAISNLIVRTVKVNRNRSGKEALTATGRTQYVDNDVVKAMPNGTDEEVELIFFQVSGGTSNENLEKEFELRNADPADPYALAAFNEANPSFADEKPNGTQWKNSKGKYCFAAFDRRVGGRRVFVNQFVNDWDVSWWFAGVRKKKALVP